jgi:membrane protease YdiL (CAAX protease family)
MQAQHGTGSNTRDDFPYYNSQPLALGAGQWALVMLGVALGFGVLIAPIPLFVDPVGQFIPAILFFAIPLAMLAWLAPRHWTAIFRKVTARHVMWMVLFALLNIVVSIAVGAVVMKFHGAHSNPVFGAMDAMDAGGIALFFLKTLPQLLGEEVVTILPMLALMTLCHQRLGLSRFAAIAIAWVLSALLFGALHLPTYGWDFVQCFVIIGSARLILSLAYLKTKSIWVSAGAHIINDWALFGMGLLGAAAHAT